MPPIGNTNGNEVAAHLAATPHLSAAESAIPDTARMGVLLLVFRMAHEAGLGRLACGRPKRVARRGNRQLVTAR